MFNKMYFKNASVLNRITNQINLKISIAKQEVKDWTPPSKVEAF